MTTQTLPPLTPEQEVHLLQQDFTTVCAMFVTPAQIDAWLQMSSDKRAQVLTKSDTTSYLQAYTYKAEVSLNLQIGDLVTVMAQGELKVVQITQVHDAPQLDLYAKHRYKWVIDKLNLNAYQRRQAEEKELKKQLHQAHYLAQQKRLIATLETLPGLPTQLTKTHSSKQKSDKGLIGKILKK